MPIYEYACETCGHQFERLVRIGAEAPPCPNCETGSVKKRVSAAGFILKGSGWYKDHYGLKGSSGSSGSGGGSSASSSTSTSASSSTTGASSPSGSGSGSGAGGTTT